MCAKGIEVTREEAIYGETVKGHMYARVSCKLNLSTFIDL